jgi:uncharacterized protein
MQINVAQLLKESIGAMRSFELDEELDFDGRRVWLRGELTLARLKVSILVTGDVEARLAEICSRCLQEFETTVSFKMAEEFMPTIDIDTGLPLEISTESDAFTINEHHIIDIGEAFRQYLILALPMKPLCQPDCPGLCPVCGKNLKEGDCGCDRTPQDIRWTELKKIFAQSHRKG